MRYLFVMLFVLTGLATPALADRQVYSPYPQPTFANDPYGMAQQQAIVNSYRQTPNTYMVYPGREQYGQAYGSIPRHPGDYRDAVDRGSWTGGGSGSRSFDIR
ncbi:MAG: hypothetical protein DI551_06410 [Micavibrio aeruginosavorus]|uniref:Uncharacterized protein n=1 Tax=Micavibrio aeruginosavorus TaxID=349221 RepID=A0A2W5N043_9BACT|nr:MAG: hypothetical protein DI551_06410 [Micavibrio aeruginosavorus]